MLNLNDSLLNKQQVKDLRKTSWVIIYLVEFNTQKLNPDNRHLILTFDWFTEMRDIAFSELRPAHFKLARRAWTKAQNTEISHVK